MVFEGGARRQLAVECLDLIRGNKGQVVEEAVAHVAPVRLRFAKVKFRLHEVVGGTQQPGDAVSDHQGHGRY